MADEIDIAQERAQEFTAAALAGIRRMTCAPAATHCDDCGDDIPEIRRKAMPGARRCVFCQGLSERR